MTLETFFLSKKIFHIWWSSLCIKLIVSALIPLAADESYYWVWSQNLQLSYFDHPAMIAWLFKLGDPFSQFGSAVRWPGVILGHATLLVWIHILKEYTDLTKIGGWLLLILFSPLLGIGSLIMTPDVPVVFFWSLSQLLLQNLLKKDSVAIALLLGLSLGLGFCSKYHIVLFVPTALLYLRLQKRWSAISWRAIGLVIVFGLISSLPVLVWNFQNNFASFMFQINHGLGRPSWNPFWTYSYPIGQALLIFPIPLWFALKSWKNPNTRYLQFFSWVPLFFFFISSFRGVVEMNWPIIAYPSIYALAAIGMKSIKPLKWTLAFWICLLLVISSQLIHPWMINPPEKLSEMSYFEPTLEAKKKYAPLFAESYQMASYLWFKTKSPTYKLYQMSRRDFYDELLNSKPSSYPFYLVMDRNAGLPEWLIKEDPKIETVDEISSIFVVLKVSKKL